jgi:hemolysin activation/secretion protein
MMMLKKILLSFLLASFANFLNAQDIPTVDDINKNEPKLPSQQEKLPSDDLKLEQNDKVEKIDEDQILKILVKDFNFDGNIKYSDEELKKIVEKAINKELGYNQLLEITRVITNFYRSKGYLATSYLPPQDIENGIVKIKIAEAMLGAIIFEID